jgi:nucleoside-diphosphate-sugar epimerase
MTLAGETVLVTGATGFLGGALAMRLAKEGARVRALARRPAKGHFLLENPHIEIMQGDITDAARMREVVKGCTVVFHVAAALGGDIQHQRRMNAGGTQNVTQAAGEAGVQRLVHVSTISYYGYGASGNVTEDTPPTPVHDPYPISKREAETALRESAARYNLPYSIIRPAMIYGPRSSMWTGNLFKLAKRRPTIFLGDGSGSAYPIFVDDVVDLMVVLATHPQAAGETFNCAPDPSPTWRTFLGAYSQLAGHQSWLGISPALVKPFVNAAALVARPETQMKDLPNMMRQGMEQVTYKMTKARDVLGWSAQVDLQTGIQRCLPWLREQGLLA